MTKAEVKKFVEIVEVIELMRDKAFELANIFKDDPTFLARESAMGCAYSEVVRLLTDDETLKCYRELYNLD